MSKQEIEVIVHPDGRVEAVAKGFKGPVCLKDMGVLFGKLGKMEHGKTDEWFDQRVEVVRSTGKAKP